MATSVEHADLKCPECNAAVDPPTGEFVNKVVACGFCGKKIRFRRDPPPRPSAGVALQVQLPQWHAERYKPGALSIVVPLIVVLVLAGAGVGIWLSVSGTTRHRGPGGDDPHAVAVGPVVCTGPLRIDNQTLRGAGPLVDARDGCVLTIAGTNLEAAGVAITASGTAKVNVSNGAIKSGGAAVVASGTANVTLDNTTIAGVEGVVAEGEAVATLTNCTVTATRAATRTSENGKIEAGDSNTLKP